jgi:hypothetical protein
MRQSKMVQAPKTLFGWLVLGFLSSFAASLAFYWWQKKQTQ